MSKITRRNVLTGIAGCSMAVALGCKTEQKSIRRAKLASGGPFTKLNVVIHGLMAIVINKAGPDRGISLVMPPFRDAAHPEMSHQYLFGNLVYTVGSELDQMQSLGPSDICTLSGFSGSPQRPTPNSFDPNLNLIFSNVSLNCSGCRQFNLPWTTQIKSLAVIHRDDNANLMNDTCGTGFGNFTKLSSVCVLSYDLKSTGPNPDLPQITYDLDGSDTGWSLQQGGDSTQPEYANLNIFAESPKHADSPHAVNAFAALMGAIGKTCLTFIPFPNNKMVQDKDNSLPTGVTSGFDTKHLGDLSKGGELANCVSAIIFP